MKPSAPGRPGAQDFIPTNLLTNYQRSSNTNLPFPLRAGEQYPFKKKQYPSSPRSKEGYCQNMEK
jgi:hypothetical protein